MAARTYETLEHSSTETLNKYTMFLCICKMGLIVLQKELLFTNVEAECFGAFSGSIYSFNAIAIAI